jgi:hypothetical protein
MGAMTGRPYWTLMTCAAIQLRTNHMAVVGFVSALEGDENGKKDTFPLWQSS